MLDPVCLFQVLSQVFIGQGPTNRNQCSYSTIVHSTLFLTPLASGARVGARVEVKKNDLGKVSRIFSLRSKSMLDPVCLSSVFWRRHTSSYNVPAPFTLSPLDCWRTSNAGTWLSNATLRYLSLAERCHTQEFFILLKNEKNPKNEVKFEYFPDQFCSPPPYFFLKTIVSSLGTHTAPQLLLDVSCLLLYSSKNGENV